MELNILPSNTAKCLNNDTATENDLLGFKPYVEAIAEFLTAEDTLSPITLSIEGQWGCGKSSFMKQLREELEKRNLSLFQVKTWIFLNYLFSINRGKNSKDQILIRTLNKSFTESSYSFTNKFCSIILYANSKIKKCKCFSNTNNENLTSLFSASNIVFDNKLVKWKYIASENLSQEISDFLEYLFATNEGKISTNIISLTEVFNKLFSEKPYSFTSKFCSTVIYIDSKIKRKKYFTVWFNAWKCEKNEELWASFALNFMDELSKQLSWVYRQYSRVRLLHLRYKLKLKSNFLIFVHFSWNILFFTLIIIFLYIIINYILISLKIPLPYFVNSELIQKFIGVALILTPLMGVVKYFSTEQLFIDLFRDPFGLKKLESNTNYKEHISFRENFYSDFNKIVESYVGNSRVYVFIDDLDRCEVPIAAELMQAINLMTLDDSKVYFSLGIDRKVISAGIAVKNKKIIDCLGGKELEYGYDFIEKFIQLPFKVPSPKSDDFNGFIETVPKKEDISKKMEISGKILLSKVLAKLRASSRFLPNGEEVRYQKTAYEFAKKPVSGGSNIKTEDTTTIKTEDATIKTEDPKLVPNYSDCPGNPKKLEYLVKIAAPVLENNPRRIKQFINQFNFLSTIGCKTGLFLYNEGKAPQHMWNCKKLAKFVAISIMWPSLIFAISSNARLFDNLQKYALKPENEDPDLEKLFDKELIELLRDNSNGSENLMLEQWIKDERLNKLLREGCVKDGKISQDVAEYVLSGLDLRKLLQISPIVEYFGSTHETSVMPKESQEAQVSLDSDSLQEVQVSLSGVIQKKDFVRISSGEFMMGSSNEQGRNEERPIHKVTIRNSFFLSKYLVTQKQWKAVMGNNPSTFKDDERPVENVSWYDAQEFIRKLNQIEGTNKYRLPSEAEWEYACRAGTQTKYFFGNDESELDKYAWYGKNSGGQTHPVGHKIPNPWGLYDMHGNVWEWCQDLWHENYEGAPSDGSAWVSGNSSLRVYRGGDWYLNFISCRSAFRYRSDPDIGYYNLSFRLLMME